MSRRESVGRTTHRKQSLSAAPEMEMVSVAVLPPRLPEGMAPPSGLGAADLFAWDERLNYQQNELLDEPGRKKSFANKLGLTTQRKKFTEAPPFVMRQIPYEKWRKHYAKDANGNYRGTHAPAQDCLLKPEDVARWRLEEPVYKADLWTRGSDVLPVYDEVQAEGAVPEYEAHYDHPPRDEPIIEEDGFSDDENNHMRPQRPVATAESSALHPVTTAGSSSLHPVSTAGSSSLRPTQSVIDYPDVPPQKTIADGKTAAQIIAEAQSKPKKTRKEQWKAMLKNGANITMLGS